jgi:hypothetical protein
MEMNSQGASASTPFLVDDEAAKMKRLRKYEDRERRHRFAGVLFNGLVLFLVWLLYREDFDRNRFVVRDAFYRLKFLFVSMGLLATFVTTVILVVRLNRLEKAHDRTEPDL